MKLRNLLVILISLILVSNNNFVMGQTAKPVTVVELFTSEGCSSCPAADELLKEMSGLRENEGKPFIALSFHVTYWDHLGWKDPYSNEVYTNRQENYVSILRLRQLYTPQAIVNGAHEFVGSNPIAFRDTLTKVERKKPTFTLVASALKKGDSVEIQYTLSKEPRNQLLNIALIEKNNERIVTRGENKNRTLKHFNVVREFITIEPKSQDVVTLTMPGNLRLENSNVVLYVQHKKTMKILGAVSVDVK